LGGEASFENKDPVVALAGAVPAEKVVMRPLAVDDDAVGDTEAGLVPRGKGETTKAEAEAEAEAAAYGDGEKGSLDGCRGSIAPIF
jgi:hypothetical protein